MISQTDGCSLIDRIGSVSNQCSECVLCFALQCSLCDSLNLIRDPVVNVFNL